VGGKRIFGGLKAYLRATDHTSSNIIIRVSGVGGKHIFGGLKFWMWEESVFLVD
jgi:mevalonate pyrophosphate decarboxylase